MKPETHVIRMKITIIMLRAAIPRATPFLKIFEVINAWLSSFFLFNHLHFERGNIYPSLASLLAKP